MSSKDPLKHLDELIVQASERIAHDKSETTRLAGRIRELEAENRRMREEIDTRPDVSERTSELEAKISRFEKEREDVRKRVESAAGRLRKLLATPEGEAGSGAGPSEAAASPESVVEEAVAASVAGGEEA